MEIGQRVKTKNEYNRLFNKKLKGKIIKIDMDGVVHLQIDCGCVHKLNIAWLKPIQKRCKC